MAKAEWGSKRICLSCGAKFYDFARAPIICPKCETTFVPVDLSKTKRARAAPRRTEAVAKKAPSEAKTEATVDESDDSENGGDGDDGGGPEDDTTEDIAADDDDGETKGKAEKKPRA